MRFLIAVAALCAAGPAIAQTCPAAIPDPVPRDAVRLNWVRPATNTDGSSLPGSTALTYTVYERVGATDTLRCTTTAVSASQTGLSVGAHSWVVTAKTATSSESAKSNVASKTIQPATPSAPGNLTADPGDLTAWTVVTTEGAIVALEVGQVAPGAACDASQAVLPFGRTELLYRVPETSVSFLPNQTALVTFALCGGG